MSAAALSAIQADVVRSQASGQAGGVEKLRVEPRNFEVEKASLLIPIDREIAVQLFHASGSFLDALRGLCHHQSTGKNRRDISGSS